jgi:hypothetical protein
VKHQDRSIPGLVTFHSNKFENADAWGMMIQITKEVNETKFDQNKTDTTKTLIKTCEQTKSKNTENENSDFPKTLVTNKNNWRQIV